MPAPRHGPFRHEAYEHHYHRSDRAEAGDVLRVSARWAHGAFWVLALVFVAAAVFSVVGRVGEYATGDAVVVSADRLVALLPARRLPLLRPGMPVTLRLTGFEGVRHELVIGEVAGEPLSPQDAQEQLGVPLPAQAGNAGPLALARLHLPGPAFRAEDRSWPYRPGMTGRVEIRLRSRPLLSLLVPALGRDRGGR